MAERRHLTVLVTGATGNQGGAVAHELLRRDHRVRAFTRRPGSGAARTLEAAGADVVEGSFEDAGSLRRAAEGVDAVFLMSTPFEHGVEAEQEQAIRAIDAFREVGVDHLVYSSVASADRDTGIPHFESKRRIEQHLERSEAPFTVVAPVSFMENLWMQPELREGRLSWGLPASRPLQQVALTDLARVTASLLERRDPYLGRRIEVASDELTGPQAALILTDVTGYAFEYVERSPEELAGPSEDFRKMLEWLAQEGYSVDLPKLQDELVEIDWHTFEQWAHAQDWRVLERYPPRGARPRAF